MAILAFPAWVCAMPPSQCIPAPQGLKLHERVNGSAAYMVECWHGNCSKGSAWASPWLQWNDLLRGLCHHTDRHGGVHPGKRSAEHVAGWVQRAFALMRTELAGTTWEKKLRMFGLVGFYPQAIAVYFSAGNDFHQLWKKMLCKLLRCKL